MTADDKIALIFNALAHPRRARIFRLLVDDSRNGQTYATLRAATGLSNAALIHHVRVMEASGLIRRKRRGAEVSYLLDSAEFCRTIALAHTMAVDARLHPKAA
ncbi:MAG: helix-turn-helix domain-containing protein [Pseudomonadota bacterium]|nr:helix-turn-helix domain-containing protein [Pseudomonadota bacterium]